MKIPNFKGMLAEIEKDRGITEESLISAIKDALVSAYKKRFPQVEEVEAKIDENGEMKLFVNKLIVEDITNKDIQISLVEAKKIKEDSELGDKIEIEVTSEDFGRTAAQTAKQVVIQRIREAEKENVFEEFSAKVGTIITGTVQNMEGGSYLLNLGRIETFLTIAESIPGENLRPQDKIKVFVVEVKKTSKGPFIMVSRTHPDIVRRLFEFEIPEIKQGIIEIKAIAREAGRRSKVAVYSNDPNIGAVGTCVGPMGSRIQSVTRELSGERIDIVEWAPDDAVFVARALSPAKVTKVEVNKENNTAKVILPEKEFSLAIGKEGQNVRLAAKLTGYRIDIASDSELKPQVSEQNSSAVDGNKHS